MPDKPITEIGEGALALLEALVDLVADLGDIVGRLAIEAGRPDMAGELSARVKATAEKLAALKQG